MDQLSSLIPLEDLVDQVDWFDQVESTNRYLASQPPSTGSRIVASWNQTSGSGRLGRRWVSPAGKSLAISFELGPQLTPDVVDEQWRGAVPLLVATHLTDSLTPLVGGVGVKWPNDVLVGSKKVAGILGEIPSPGRVIIGIGLNVWLSHEDLPAQHSTSLGSHGLSSPEELNTLIRRFIGGLVDALTEIRSGVGEDTWDQIRGRLLTLGQQVAVSYPDGTVDHGLAVEIDHTGRLLVQLESGETKLIAAADVEHLRTQSGQ